MENLSQLEETQVEQTSSLHQVTPLSKYLAMALFIILPFVGGYIGYYYAPDKVVEVERVVVSEVRNENKIDNKFKYLNIEKLSPNSRFGFDLYEDTSGWLLYENTEYGFSFKHPPGSQIKKFTQEDYSRVGWGEKKRVPNIFPL